MKLILLSLACLTVTCLQADVMPDEEIDDTVRRAEEILKRSDAAATNKTEELPGEFEQELFRTLAEDANASDSEDQPAERREEQPVAEGGKVATIGGSISDFFGTKLPKVKTVLFNDSYYRDMLTTPGGNYGFTVVRSNDYTLTASYGNQFFYTNVCLIPPSTYRIDLTFTMPITVYGQLTIDGKPAQHGLFLRLISPRGGQAGGIVMSNGLFHIKDMTPGRYTMVLERRKRFIDRRINETRFYYFPVTLTTRTARITVERDRRKLEGTVMLDSLPRRHVDALVTLKDATTRGLLIHREAYTYTKNGYFAFNNILPGTYYLQATQSQREWKSKPVLVKVGPKIKRKKVTIDVILDPLAKDREIEDLKRQFIKQ